MRSLKSKLLKRKYCFVEGGLGDQSAIKITKGEHKDVIFVIDRFALNPDLDEYGVDYRVLQPFQYPNSGSLETLVSKIALDIMEDVASGKYSGNVEYI